VNELGYETEPVLDDLVDRGEGKGAKPENAVVTGETDDGGDSSLVLLGDDGGNREFPNYAAYRAFATTNQLKVLSEYEMYKQGHWLKEHRMAYQYGLGSASKVDGYPIADVFSNATAVNTLRLASGEYTNLYERKSYYKWANLFFFR
jgi:hypothetical protein